VQTPKWYAWHKEEDVMKRRSRAFIGACFLALLVGASAYPQNLLTDDFAYPVRDSLEGLGGWFRSGVNSSSNIQVVAPGLVFSGYPGSGVGNAVALSNDPSGDIVLRDFPPQSFGSVYLSAMIVVDSLAPAATSGYVLGFDEAGGNTALNTRLLIRRLGETHYEFGIAKLDSPAFASNSHQTGIVHLVVLKYTFVPGEATNDTAKLFVLHNAPPSTEPEPDTVCTASFDIDNVGQLFITNSYDQDGLQGSHVRIDGIRIGTTWSGAVLSSVDELETSVPGEFVLEQNYPNPFNPRTEIAFRLGEARPVTLTVYDLLGREITTLINSRLEAGEHVVSFDGKGLGSGIYIYRIHTGDFAAGKKMVLLK
jgi:hypothetical protein